MGRPLPKRFFGNENTGSASTTADDGIGGEGIASINWSNLGLFRGNDATNNPLVGLALPAPTLPGGVQATWTVTFEVASVSTGSGKAGLVVGDTYTYASGNNPTITVASVSGTNATFTTTGGGGVDLGSLPPDSTGVNITKVSGSGVSTFFVDVNFKVRSAVINEKGSGYTGVETFTATPYSMTTGVAPAGTLVLTVPDGVPYDAYAFTTINCTAMTANAGSALPGDIISQRGNRRYKVKTTDGTAVCSLVTTTPASAGEMTITATDYTGTVYYVTRLKRHRVTLLKQTGSTPEFADNTSAAWTTDTLTSADTGIRVRIDNA
jgi:hypothetical protein